MSALAPNKLIRDNNSPFTARVIKVSPSIHISIRSKSKNDTPSAKTLFDDHRNLDSILLNETNRIHSENAKKTDPDPSKDTYSAMNKSTKSIIDAEFKQKTSSAIKMRKHRQNPYHFTKSQGIPSSNVKSDFAHIRTHHTNKKKCRSFCQRPCSWLCIFGAILCLLLLCIVIAAILIGILIKPSSTTATSTSSTTNSLIDPCMSGIYWNVTGITCAGTNTGIPGSALNELSLPVSLYIDSNDNLYVGDGGNRRVMKYTLGATSGIRVAGSGVGGTALNQLSSTGFRYIYVDSSENIYISDSSNQRVVRWASGASSGVIVAGNGTPGTALELLQSPCGVWVDSNSNVYVSEYGNDRITKWPLGATTGILVAGNTSQSGASSDRLCAPTALYFDEVNQDLYVANSFAPATTVMRWRIGSFHGTVIAGLPGYPGSNATQLLYPMGVTVDRWKNLYVTDLSGQYVKLFCNGKRDGIVIAGASTGGTSLSSPYDVKLDSQMNLYVLQRSANRVTKFFKRTI